MCVKCIIDPGKLKAAAKHLAACMKTFAKTVKAFQSRKKCPVPLSSDEWDVLMAVSQEQCDLADHINDKLREWNDKTCAIAVAHSHPHTKETP